MEPQPPRTFAARRSPLRRAIASHVGIVFGGQVFNYSNSQGKVVADGSVELFHAKFKRAYAGDDISLYYGIAP